VNGRLAFCVVDDCERGPRSVVADDGVSNVGVKYDVVAGVVTVQELAAEHLQAPGFGTDQWARRVAWIDAVNRLCEPRHDRALIV
jgi:hypothetical protein